MRDTDVVYVHCETALRSANSRIDGGWMGVDGGGAHAMAVAEAPRNFGFQGYVDRASVETSSAVTLPP